MPIPANAAAAIALNGKELKGRKLVVMPPEVQ
jgi:hypothetical protein